MSLLDRRAAAWAVSAAALILAAGAGNASANGFSLGSQTFRTVYEPLTIRGAGSGTSVVRCNVTLAGSFYERTFSSTGPVEIGVINSAEIGRCDVEGVRVSFLTETLPWSIVYTGFTGTLPNISTMEFDYRGMRILVEASPFIACLYRTTQGTPARYIWTLERGTVSQERFESATSIPRLSRLHEDVFFTCGESIQLSGGTEPISFTLI